MCWAYFAEPFLMTRLAAAAFMGGVEVPVAEVGVAEGI